MSFMLYTDVNMEAFKAALRRVLPQVKSSHLTEAIAYGTGHQTHAALLAQAASTPPQWPLLLGISAPHIVLRLRQLGYDIAGIGSIRAFTRPEAVIDKMYIEVKNRDLRTVNAWFRMCQDRNIPYVYLEKMRKYYRLHWDCISLSTKNETHVTGDAGDMFGKMMFHNFQTLAKTIPEGKPTYFASSFAGSIKHLDERIAHQMAEMIFGMLYLPLFSQAAVA